MIKYHPTNLNNSCLYLPLRKKRRATSLIIYKWRMRRNLMRTKMFMATETAGET